jgi:hypothetical protein
MAPTKETNKSRCFSQDQEHHHAKRKNYPASNQVDYGIEVDHVEREASIVSLQATLEPFCSKWFLKI